MKGLENKGISGIAASVRTVVPGSVYFANGTKQTYRSNVIKAFSKGALCAVTKYPIKDDKGDNLPCIECDNPVEAAVSIAAILKKHFDGKTIAITGSIGKTSCKEMIRLVTSCRYKTVYSKSNQNGFGQVVRYAQNLEQDVEVYIQEAGISRPGSLDRAARVLQPDIFVITNIGLNHVGYFGGDQKGILQEKLALDRHASERGVGFVNWDDPLLRGASYAHRVISYSTLGTDADYYAQNIVEKNGKISFEIIEKSSGYVSPIVLNIVGRHNVSNAVCAFAVGRFLGIADDEIGTALSRFSATGVRQNLVYLAGQHVYLDCYNASEGAIKSVADTLRTIDVPDEAKRILVLGDIDDKLGDRTEEIHRRVGETLSLYKEDIGLLLCYGKHAAWVAEEASRNGMSVLSTQSREQLESWIMEHMDPSDLVAFKGGQQMLLSKTVDNVFGTPFFMLDGDMVDKASRVVEKGGYRFRILEDYGVEIRGFADGAAGAIEDMEGIPCSIEGMDVRLVGYSAFHKSKLRAVRIPATVRAINRAAFFRASRLEKITLPEALDYIGPSAFNTCPLLKEVAIPEGTRTIAHRAFAFCENLEHVLVPDSVKTIEDEVFLGSPKVRIICSNRSYAFDRLLREYPDKVTQCS